jgi:hypothetical protein
MKIKTSDLIGLALDWAVAKCEVGDPVGSFLDGVIPHPNYTNFHPSTDWSKGRPIIEREGIEVVRGNDLIFPNGNEKGEYTEPLWLASCGVGRKFHGQTPLISAMRCYVASRLGDEVEVPEELLLPGNARSAKGV